MPEDAPAMIAIVPVGAMQVRVALRYRVPPGLPRCEETSPGLPRCEETSLGFPGCEGTSLGLPRCEETSLGLPRCEETSPGLPRGALAGSPEMRGDLAGSPEMRGDLAGIDRALPIGEDALFLAERCRGGVRRRGDLAHQPLGQLERPVGVVGDAGGDQQVGEAHHAEPDLAIAAHRLRDLLEREGARVHDVVEEAHRQLDRLAQRRPVEVAGRPVPELGDVDRAEGAGLPGQ